MNRSSRERQAGFSLLEVIAAILLLAIAFGALMQVAGSSINLTARAAERSQAAMVARSMLDSAGQLEPLRPGSTDGRYEDYRWRMTVTPWGAGEVSSPALTLYKVDLQLWWGHGREERNAHFATVRALGASPTGGV